VCVFDDDPVVGTAALATGNQDKAAGISLIGFSGAGPPGQRRSVTARENPLKQMECVHWQQMVLRETLQVTLLLFAFKTSALSMQSPL
jgi:hypothetical protein